MTWNQTTARTLMVTLSLVITSCGWTSRVMVRRSILKSRSIPKGMIRKSPGPFRLMSRPKRKAPPRSYSRAMRTLIAARTITMKTTTISAGITNSKAFSLSSVGSEGPVGGTDQVLAVGVVTGEDAAERDAHREPPEQVDDAVALVVAGQRVVEDDVGLLGERVERLGPLGGDVDLELAVPQVGRELLANAVGELVPGHGRGVRLQVARLDVVGVDEPPFQPPRHDVAPLAAQRLPLGTVLAARPTVDLVHQEPLVDEPVAGQQVERVATQDQVHGRPEDLAQLEVDPAHGAVEVDLVVEVKASAQEHEERLRAVVVDGEPLLGDERVVEDALDVHGPGRDSADV